MEATLSDTVWADRLTPADRRDLTALFWQSVNPYGVFRLDMTTRLDIAA